MPLSSVTNTARQHRRQQSFAVMKTAILLSIVAISALVSGDGLLGGLGSSGSGPAEINAGSAGNLLGSLGGGGLPDVSGLLKSITGGAGGLSAIAP
uniref:Secreted protein n=1 Tax=Steinernema glaseri TaxID=37863 RepID=A0A1I7YBP0_9BILA